MDLEMRTLDEINRLATEILFRELGVVDATRFFNQFTLGQGDYTKDRETWLADISLDQAVSEIRSERERRPDPVDKGHVTK